MSALGPTPNLSGPEETVHLCHSDVCVLFPFPESFCLSGRISASSRFRGDFFSLHGGWGVGIINGVLMEDINQEAFPHCYTCYKCLVRDDKCIALQYHEHCRHS